MSVKATILHANRLIIALRRMTGLLEMNRLVCCHRTPSDGLPARLRISGVSTSTETGEMDPEELTPTGGEE